MVYAARYVARGNLSSVDLVFLESPDGKRLLVGTSLGALLVFDRVDRVDRAGAQST